VVLTGIRVPWRRHRSRGRRPLPFRKLFLRIVLQRVQFLHTQSPLVNHLFRKTISTIHPSLPSIHIYHPSIYHSSRSVFCHPSLPGVLRVSGATSELAFSSSRLPERTSLQPYPQVHHALPLILPPLTSFSVSTSSVFPASRAVVQMWRARMLSPRVLRSRRVLLTFLFEGFEVEKSGGFRY
jgi:hypothetical protein